MAVFGVGLVGFVTVERGRQNAFIDFQLFRNMNLSGTLFLGFSQGNAGGFVGDVLHMTGRQDNVPVRSGAAIALTATLVCALLAALVAAVAVPKGKQQD